MAFDKKKNNIKLIILFFQGWTPKMQFFRAGTAQTIDLSQCILARKFASLFHYFEIMVNLPNGMAMTKI